MRFLLDIDIYIVIYEMLELNTVFNSKKQGKND